MAESKRLDNTTDITCIDKIEANILIKIKFDPKTLNWYVKSVKMAHNEDSFE